MKTVFIVLFVTESDNIGLRIEVKGVYSEEADALARQEELRRETAESEDWKNANFSVNKEDSEWYASDESGTAACSIYKETVK